MTTEYTYLLFSPFVFLFVCLLFFVCYYLYIYVFFPGKKVRSIYKNVVNIFR